MLLLNYTRTSLMTSDMKLIVLVMSFFPDQYKELNFRRLYIQGDPGFFPASSNAQEL